MDSDPSHGGSVVTFDNGSSTRQLSLAPSEGSWYADVFGEHWDCVYNRRSIRVIPQINLSGQARLVEVANLSLGATINARIGVQSGAELQETFCTTEALN